MHRVGLIIELLEPAIFSASAATAAAHDTVHVIPGSALLGAAARHYKHFKDKEAWNAFHSGAVRFEDGLPLTDSGECALPMPNSLHVKKRALPVFGKDSNVVNGTIAAALDTKTDNQPDQYVQLRGNFLTASGAMHRVKTLSETKSAIAEGEMRAADGQLFVYQALSPDQRFYAEIAGADAKLVDDIAEKLLGQQHLGRSKSAEFGAAIISRSDRLLSLGEPAGSNDGSLVLWCLSPLALLDAFGNPTLVPTAASLGLKAGAFEPERSFIRFTTQRSFNQHRNSFDVDRPVLQRGSVLVFSGIDNAQAAKLGDGVGVHQNLGYGRVWVNPPMLQATALSALGGTAQPIHPQNAKLSAVTTKPNLLSWMKKQANSSAATNHALAKTMVAELATLYATANRDTVNVARASAGPSKSQWGAVMEILKDAKDIAGASATLFSATGCCKPTGVGWQDRVYDGTKMISFYDWFKTKFLPEADLATLQQFSREALRAAELAGGRR